MLTRLRQQLQDGTEQLQLALTATQIDALLEFLQLLKHWNKSFNLTAIDDMSTMITRHILDSLVLVPFIQGPQVLDIGTGAGLPGLPLAITLPQLHFTLLDSSGKKIRFLTQVKHQLGLDQIEPVQSRIEDHQTAKPYQTITSRAFAATANIVKLSGGMLANDGQLLLLKANTAEHESTTIDQTVWSSQIKALSVPGLAAKRSLILIRKAEKPRM